VSISAGRAVAAIGVVLALIGIWIDAVPGSSYWDFDGTTAALMIVLAGLAALALAAGFVAQPMDGAVLAAGAVLLGFDGWFPAATAFDDWDETRAGMWLAFAGAALIVVGAAVSLLAAGLVRATPPGISPPALTAGLGVALVFPGIFLDASGGQSYWDGPLGHSLGVVMLVLAVACTLAWAATVGGMSVRGIDAALAFVLLGLVAFAPVGAAFGDFGSLDAGAWLALAGGILAAGGTWAARGEELPSATPAAV
jgi:hypothetical protein